MVKWKDGVNITDFEISTKLARIEASYLAIGFSNDNSMGNDGVVMCKYNLNADVYVQHYYNEGKKSFLLSENEPSVGLFDSKISLSQNHLICSFKRIKLAENFNDKYSDLNKMHYLLVAKGKIDQNSKINKFLTQSYFEGKFFKKM